MREARESTRPSSLEAFREGKEIPSAVPGSLSEPLKDIYFEFDRYTLRSDARVTLEANAEWLKANPSVRIEIEGHADERGTNEYNLALGARRAQSAKDYLVTLGVSPDRLSTISYGEELPVCREKTEECWQTNRRAHFVMITVRPSS
ncbi:MAG: peptidoglycan-associated lipoprotein Pal [Candidatus Binatia bacterium]